VKHYVTTLTDTEIQNMRELAKKRDAKKALFGAGRHGKLTSSSEESHFRGLVGEFAVAKFFGTQLDTAIHDDHGDEGFDVEVAGLKADIKVAAHPMAWKDPILKVPCGSRKDMTKLEKSQLFICCAFDVSTNRLKICGFVDVDELKASPQERMNLRGGGQGPLNYIVKKENLRDIDELR